MTTATIRKKLHDLIDTADDKKVEAIYSLIEGGVDEKYDHWEDEEFVNEIKRRIDDFESGRDKGLSWEEVKTMARNELKTKL